MISDNQTNTIYFSELLKTDNRYSSIYKDIESKLADFGIKPKLLPKTKDIWARDYMPIQVKDTKYVEYRYDPDYLQAKKWRKLKSYPDIICDAINRSTEKTDLIIDGGNVVKSSNAIILTDKVVSENKDSFTEAKLIEELKKLFDVKKVILIPWDKKSEEYGHSDGMLRFIDDTKVLIQGYYNCDDYSNEFRTKLFGALKDNGIDWVEMKFNVKNEDDRNWVYMNFLQTKDVILLPKLDIPEDAQALAQIEKHFPQYRDGRVIQIKMDAIVAKGGALNCISWTTKE
jgi:agmatine/peptidylarginine deiminase